MSRQLAIQMGEELRSDVRSWVQAGQGSMRELSRRIEMEPNYITCFLRANAEDWALPKSPTLELLLCEIEVSHGDLVQRAKILVQKAELAAKKATKTVVTAQ